MSLMNAFERNRIGVYIEEEYVEPEPEEPKLSCLPDPEPLLCITAPDPDPLFKDLNKLIEKRS